ncbi:MAG TPA: DEAD/DEAH box helicase family protein [Acidimicrobiales bacterium]|nr:DEAD/DEAH box helicase family protein [Acidimicrobiales bacterium]
MSGTVVCYCYAMANLWLGTEAAAEYLGMGKTRLYELTRKGRLPAKRVGKKWMYDRDELAAWMQGSQRLEDFFQDTPFSIEDNPQLRDPQRDAYLQAAAFFHQGGKKALIQLPVGCGKSGVAAILPFGIANGRVLVVAPNLTIKDELYNAFDITNKQRCFWKQRAVLEDKHMASGPYVCTLDTGNLSVCEKSHVVLTNIQQFGTNADKWLTKFPEDFFDLIIVDEAHHGAAASWKRVFERFPNAKVANLTATPFRSDRQELDGELIFRYPFKSASIKGYVKKLKASYVAPTELTFTMSGEERTFTLEEVLGMKEEEWFSRGVALSTPCNVSIVDNSLEKLEQLRQTGTKHQLIAVACSINHARQIRSLYQERGYETAIVHSDPNKQADEQANEAVKRDLYNGVLDCVVQVQMLGEGFDHPKLSVAAIFRPFRSLAPYIQFVGRILRVVVQNDPTHPDNYGHIVTHVGMNLDELLKRFRLFENDDQKFWEEVTGGIEPEPLTAVLDGSARMKLHEDMVVRREIVEQLFEEEFTTAEDADIQRDLEKKLDALGLDPRLAEQVVQKSRSDALGPAVAPAAQPFSKVPAKQWKEAKRRLDEEARRTAKILLNRVDLKPEGVEIPRKLKPEIGAINNSIAAYMMVNKSITKIVGDGRKRPEWSFEEFIAATDALPGILDNLVRQLKRAQSG